MAIRRSGSMCCVNYGLVVCKCGVGIVEILVFDDSLLGSTEKRGCSRLVRCGGRRGQLFFLLSSALPITDRENVRPGGR